MSEKPIVISLEDMIKGMEKHMKKDPLAPVDIVQIAKEHTNMIMFPDVNKDEFEKDMALSELGHDLVRLDEVLRKEGVDLFTDWDVNELERLKNHLEKIWQILRSK